VSEVPDSEKLSFIIVDRGEVSTFQNASMEQAEDRAARFYEAIGGAEFFERLTSTFYRLVSEDDLIGPLFTPVWERHARRLADHFIDVYGKRNLGAGWDPAIQSVHTTFIITHAHRERWLELMARAGRVIDAPEPEFSDLLNVLALASLDFMAVSRGAALARGDRFDRFGQSLEDDPIGGRAPSS
jgi:truncated hemoglobin YjbI